MIKMRRNAQLMVAWNVVVVRVLRGFTAVTKMRRRAWRRRLKEGVAREENWHEVGGWEGRLASTLQEPKDRMEQLNEKN